MIGQLPTSLEVGGREYGIRSDYRNVLQVFEAFGDTELSQSDKWLVALYLMYEDFSCIEDLEAAAEEGFDIKEAVEKLNWIITMGAEIGNARSKPVFDWKKDERIIFSAVNKAYGGGDVRSAQYMHWWTFMGYFCEIGEGTFSYIVGIRDKLGRGKKLEKHEKEFYRKNREMVDIKPPKSREELEQEAELRTLIDDVLG